MFVVLYRAPGLVTFVTAAAYHLCLNLPAAFTIPVQSLLVVPCTTVPAKERREARTSVILPLLCVA